MMTVAAAAAVEVAALGMVLERVPAPEQRTDQPPRSDRDSRSADSLACILRPPVGRWFRDRAADPDTGIAILVSVGWRSRLMDRYSGSCSRHPDRR